MEKCQKTELNFKVILWPQAARGHAGIIGRIFKKTRAKYEPNPKQKHFRDDQITFLHFIVDLFWALGVESPTERPLNRSLLVYKTSFAFVSQNVDMSICLWLYGNFCCARAVELY